MQGLAFATEIVEVVVLYSDGCTKRARKVSQDRSSRPALSAAELSFQRRRSRALLCFSGTRKTCTRVDDLTMA